MNTQRFLSALKWQYTVHRHSALVRGLGCFTGVSAIGLLLMLFTGSSVGNVFFESVYAIGFYFIVIFGGCMMNSDMKTRQQRISVLMLPAGNLEKFAARYVWFMCSSLLTCMLGFFLSYNLLYVLGMVFMPASLDSYMLFPRHMQNVFALSTGALYGHLGVWFLHVAYLVSGLFFRRLSWLWASLILTFVPSALMVILGITAAKLTDAMVSDGVYEVSFIFWPGETLAAAVGALLVMLLIVGGYCLAFRLWKRQQVINNRFFNC